jgi:hypothetical protein
MGSWNLDRGRAAVKGLVQEDPDAWLIRFNAR